MNSISMPRRHDLDWLRILAILAVFLFHSTRFFDLEDWHVKSAVTYMRVQIWVGFATRWMMPLIFFISGASLFYAMDKAGGWWRFYIDKVHRLFIPVIIGSLTHVSLQVYLERVSHGQFSGSFFEFLPYYFVGLSGSGPGNYNFVGNHLWYLLLLFLYCLIFYRLFLWFKEGGRGFIGKLCGILAVPGLVYVLLPLPHLLMAAGLPGAVLKAGAGGWGFIEYIVFLIAGFIIVSSQPLQDRICRQRWTSLTLGGISLIGFFFFDSLLPYRPPWSPIILGIGYHVSNVLCGWSLILAIFGFGMKHLTFINAFHKYANDAVLPFYIMHQTVLLCIGYFVLQFAVPDFFKWVIIFVISFIICLALYEFFIRRIEILRFLFGMKTSSPAFLIVRKPVAQVLIVFLFMAPIVLAIADESYGEAVFCDFNLSRTTYTNRGKPAFSFSYPANSRQEKKDSPTQVISMKTPYGKRFSVSVFDVPAGTPLSDFGPRVLLEKLKGLGNGSQHRVIENEPLMLRDGTMGYKTVISWLYKDGATHVKTISVNACKSDKCVLLAVNTWQNPKDVKWIVESLVFTPE